MVRSEETVRGSANSVSCCCLLLLPLCVCPAQTAIRAARREAPRVPAARGAPEDLRGVEADQLLLALWVRAACLEGRCWAICNAGQCTPPSLAKVAVVLHAKRDAPVLTRPAPGHARPLRIAAVAPGSPWGQASASAAIASPCGGACLSPCSCALLATAAHITATLSAASCSA